MQKILLTGLVAILLNSVSLASTAAPLQQREVAREMLAEAISHRTVPGYDQVNPLHEKFAQRLIAAGFDKSELSIIHTEAEVSALVVRLRGDGSGGSPILLMSQSVRMDQ